MRIAWLGVVAAAASLAGCQAMVARFVLPRDGIRASTDSVRITRDVGFEATDGVRLVADLYRPGTARPSPTILVRIPFTKTFSTRLGADAVGRFWASRGYNVVMQGTRGRGSSGGVHYPMRHERQDGLDTLAWLALGDARTERGVVRPPSPGDGRCPPRFKRPCASTSWAKACGATSRSGR